VRKLAALLLFVALGAAGCGGSSNKSSAGSSTAAASCDQADLTLVKSGRLTVGTDNPAFPPWFGGKEKAPWKVSDPRSGEGFESEVDWVVVPFNTAFAPGTKKFDFDVNQISFKPARAKAVDFSDSYYDVNQAIVALNDRPIASAKTVADLEPYKLGAQLGTTSYDYIVDTIKPSKKPSVFDTNAGAIQALKNKQIDGIVVDLPTAFYVTAAQVENSKIVGQFPRAATGEHFGLVLAKGSSLTPCVNDALAELKSDGTLAQLRQKWLAAAGAPVLK
jgi:polar amino acid transport system substrate-binding protein